MAVAGCGAGRRAEQPGRRPLPGPELELPLRLRDEHLEPPIVVAARARAPREQRRRGGLVDEVVHDLAVERRAVHRVAAVRARRPASR